MLPVIALVGRPNVGKSTLFNVMTRSRDALVADFSGLTRDRKYGHGTYEEKNYILIDTGGLSGESEELDEQMAKQTLLAIEESNLVLFMVDGRGGLTAADEAIAQQIRRMGKNMQLVINKTDGIDIEQAQADFASLGFAESHPIAAAHKRGVTQLVENLLSDWPEWEDEDPNNRGIKVAIVGKPNVGKSTLVNRMLGEERVVAMDMPGTTRDSIYIPFEHAGREYTFIDTAGVRRRKKVDDMLEKFSVIKAMQAIERANVVVLVIDAHEGISDQDAHLLGFVLDEGRALVIAINKWDGLTKDERARIKDELDRRLNFIDYADEYFISALHGTGVGDLFAAVDKAYASAMIKVSTSRLTQILEDAISSHAPPMVRGRRIKMRYAHQGGQNPPIIVIHGNQTKDVPVSYQRYLTNTYRKVLDLHGTPVRIEFKTGDNPFEGRRNKLTPRQQYKKKRLMKHVRKK